MNLIIKFIIITEHISFIPSNIINNCEVVSIARPKPHQYMEMIDAANIKQAKKTKQILEEIDTTTILNYKEIRSFSFAKTSAQLPTDIFNTICNQIIEDMAKKDMDFIKFRDSLYDILIYNLDVTECLWYILTHFIGEGNIKNGDVSQVLQKTYSFLKYYNNNYRPIYHLESIFFYLIIKIHGYGEPEKNDETKSLVHSRNKKDRITKRAEHNKKEVSHTGIKISSR